MSTSQKRLFSNFYSLGIIQGTNYLLPLLITPYVIMRIGADGFGVVAVAQVVMTFLQTISDYGFNLTATRDVSLNRHNPEKLSRIFYTVLSTKLLIVSVLLVGLVAVLLCVPSLRSYFILYMLSFASVIGQSLLMNWLFQGIERMKVVMYISLFARLVFVALVLLFIRQRSDYIYFLFFTGIGNILAGVVSIIVAFRLLKLRRIIPSRKDILSEFRNGWHITSSTLAVSSYMYINILALRLFTSDTIVGYYSIAEKIINAGRQILSVYFTAIYPQVCQLVMTTRRQLFDFFKKYYLPFLTLVLGGCFILFFFPVPIISVFLRDHRELSAHYLRIMSFVPFIICLNIPAYQVLIAHDEKKVLFGVFAAGTLVNLILNISVVRVWGPVGTCFTILITECLVTIGLLAAMSINQKIGIPDHLRSRART